MRRDDWRTFRLDRLTMPRLGGVRFTPQRLPAEDAAEFVAASISSMPVPLRATVVASGALDDVRNLIRYADAEVEVIDQRRCRVHLRAESRSWLLTVIALLATTFEIVVDEPADLVFDVDTLGARLQEVASSSAV